MHTQPVSSTPSIESHASAAPYLQGRPSRTPFARQQLTKNKTQNICQSTPHDLPSLPAKKPRTHPPLPVYTFHIVTHLCSNVLRLSAQVLAACTQSGPHKQNGARLLVLLRCAVLIFRSSFIASHKSVSAPTSSLHGT